MASRRLLLLLAGQVDRIDVDIGQTKPFNLLQDLFLGAFADRNHRHHRHHPADHSQHAQQGAKLVDHERSIGKADKEVNPGHLTPAIIDRPASVGFVWQSRQPADHG